jgi:hypothetical protein
VTEKTYIDNKPIYPCDRTFVQRDCLTTHDVKASLPGSNDIQQASFNWNVRFRRLDRMVENHSRKNMDQSAGAIIYAGRSILG